MNMMFQCIESCVIMMFQCKALIDHMFYKIKAVQRSFFSTKSSTNLRKSRLFLRFVTYYAVMKGQV